MLGADWILEVASAWRWSWERSRLAGILEHGYSMPSPVGGLGLGVMAGAMTSRTTGPEALYTVVGVGILALGHRLNYIASE